MTGILYIVATPIGNLDDVTLRAIKILSEVDIILAEDTRVTKKLLKFLEAESREQRADIVKLMSYHQHSGEHKKAEILQQLILGKKIALVTDAGTPGISDPGNELIDYLLQNTSQESSLGVEPFKIVPVPGVSAITTALSVSGFRTNNFVFLGFLPKKKRTKLFKWLEEGKMTFAFYESPHRILKSMQILEEYFGDRRVVVARELTKLHETIYRGTPDELLKQLEKEKVKGEIVVVVEG